MIWIGDKEIPMAKGWIVVYKDGSVIYEDEMSWTRLPKRDQIKKVILKWESRMWTLEGKEHYTVPTKRGYIDVNLGGTSQGIHSRTIGYYSVEDKCKVILRVNESTGQASWETVPFE